MTSTIQLRKTSTETETETLPTLCTKSQTCLKASNRLIKRLTAACISNITYLRAVFDEENYVTQNFGTNVKVKMFNKNSTDYGVQQHIKWLKGAFEALDQQYLKSINYVVYTDKNNPYGSIIELYKLNVVYAEVLSDTSNRSLSDNSAETTALDMSLDSQQSSVINSKKNTTTPSFFIPTLQLEEFKSRTKSTLTDAQKMMQTLSLITDQLEDYPDQTYFTMHLRYNQKTPKDYIPSGFSKEAETKPLRISDENRAVISVGDTVTNFHNFQLKACFDTRIIGKGIKRSFAEMSDQVKFDETMSNENTTKIDENSTRMAMNSQKTSDEINESGDLSDNSTLKNIETPDSTHDLINLAKKKLKISPSTPDTPKTPEVLSHLSLNLSKISPIKPKNKTKKPIPPPPLLKSQVPGFPLIAIELLREILLKKIFAPKDLQKTFPMISKDMFVRFTSELEYLEIIPYGPLNSNRFNRKRNINQIKAYKQIILEAGDKNVDINFGIIDKNIEEQWSEMVTNFNIFMAKENRDIYKKNSRKYDLERLLEMSRDTSMATSFTYGDETSGLDLGLSTMNGSRRDECDSLNVTPSFFNKSLGTTTVTNKSCSGKGVSFCLDETCEKTTTCTSSNTKLDCDSTKSTINNTNSTMTSKISHESSINLSASSATLGATTPLKLASE